MNTEKRKKEEAAEDARINITAKHLLREYYAFLKRFGIDLSAYKIDVYVVEEIATRYWRDVERLHIFHDMRRIDCRKIAGYQAYWISKLRPINAAEYKTYLEKPTVSKYINEAFAVYIAGGRINADILDRSRVLMEDDTLAGLLYSLKYRAVSGDTLTLFFDMAKKLAIPKSSDG